MLGRRLIKADPSIKGRTIPKLFYKVIVWPDEKRLRVVAFVVSQEDLLAKLLSQAKANEASRFEAGLSDDEVQLYQVSLADLERVTQMSFGKLTKLKSSSALESTAESDSLVSVETEDDIPVAQADRGRLTQASRS